MLSFSLVAEALTGLIYHHPSGENSKFLPLSDYLEHLEVSQLMGGHGAKESILLPDMGGNLMAHSDE